jgi:hypothetical protein
MPEDGSLSSGIFVFRAAIAVAASLFFPTICAILRPAIRQYH